MLESRLKEAGPLRTVSFVGVGQQGWDVYQLTFEHVTWQARILIDSDQKVDGLFTTTLP